MSVKLEILSKLNEQQKEPVINYRGASLVIAGPGSGKTFSIVSRVAYMIDEGIEPSSIALFSFTNKAAREIQERVERMIGRKARLLSVSTYHSFCCKLLRRYADRLGFSSNFSIYDSDDSQKLLKKLITNNVIDPKMAAIYISACKDNMISPNKAKQDALTEFDRQKAEIYDQYQKNLKANNAFDFDDLIVYTVRLLSKEKEVCTEVNRKYKYIICDETQDSSLRDGELIMLLTGSAGNVCCVLDDDQSIYRFRGADIGAVFAVQKRYNAKQYVLGQNYRSTQMIVSASRSVIANNKNQLPKTLFTNNKKGERVMYMESETSSLEAKQVVQIIKALQKKEKLKLEDIAILYRTSYLSRKLEDCLLKNKIAYKMVGGTPFYSRKEVKDMLSYLRFLVNPSDLQALSRALSVPKRGLGEKTILKILDAIYENNLNSDIIENKTEKFNKLRNIDLKGVAKKGLENFIAIIETLQLKLNNENCSIGGVIRDSISIIGYDKYLQDTEEDATDRLDNIKELANIASNYDDLESFILEMSLGAKLDDEGEEEQDKVNMLTMHSSKGLEYKAVIIVGANEGIIPHFRSLDDITSIEEERRLFYVAMTRAQEYLFITRPKTSLSPNGSFRADASRFIAEIGSEYIVQA